MDCFNFIFNLSKFFLKFLFNVKLFRFKQLGFFCPLCQLPGSVEKAVACVLHSPTNLSCAGCELAHMNCVP